jgi:hypothetical protein
MSTAIAVQSPQPVAMRNELDVADVIAQVQKIQRVMEQVMKKDEHYGVIPGTNKPTLLKPGAEKLCLTFRLDPQYDSTPMNEAIRPDGHCFIDSKCTLYHIPTGLRMGSGEGACSTKESKYAYRKGARVCPNCGEEAIIKGSDQYGGGWVCWKKKGGCGVKWKDGAEEIESQSTDRVANEDLGDLYNTIKKMANKRALVAAVLNVTAASDIFTQDLEDAPPPPPPAPTTNGGEARARKQTARDSSGSAATTAAPTSPTEAEVVTESERLFVTTPVNTQVLIQR